MKCFLFICIFLCGASLCTAKGIDPKKDVPKTEGELINKILNCLQYKDTITYASLFANPDTVWQMILDYMDTTDKRGMDRLNKLRQNPKYIYRFDPYYNPMITKSFYHVVRKGEDSGIHWNNIVLVRYELQKVRLTKQMAGYEKIATTELQGFVFIRDILTRDTWCVTVNEMQQIKGYWYGGEVKNILQASTIDEYFDKERKEKIELKRRAELGLTEDSPIVMAGLNDTVAKQKHNINVVNNINIEDEEKKVTQEVVDRKYYTGFFDNEIPVKLYIQSIKGNCKEKVCAWKAIYKFGDQDDYIKLDVTKTGENKWSFEEDPSQGGMDLVLDGKVFTGTWTGGEDQTGYDVLLRQKDIPPAKLHELDNIIENGLWAKPGENKTKPDSFDEGY